MHGEIAAQASALVTFVERAEGARFEQLRIASDQGVALAFYRRSNAASGDDATLLAVVLDEELPGRWEALSAHEVGAGGSRSITARPSVRGDWVYAIYGSAPAAAQVAVLEYDNIEHRVSVEEGVYAFMTRASEEPAPTLTRPRFE